MFCSINATTYCYLVIGDTVYIIDNVVTQAAGYEVNEPISDDYFLSENLLTGHFLNVSFLIDSESG